MSVRHVDGGTFVAHVDDPNAEPCRMVPNRLNVTPLKPENPVDAASLQELRYPGGATVVIRLGDLVIDAGQVHRCVA